MDIDLSTYDLGLSGVETDLTYAAQYTFRDGKLRGAREYWTREEALEAAGLST
jgi:ketosteroid isomerase-like protein